MRPVVTDRVAWSAGRSVGLSVTIVSPTKTAEPIEVPFGVWTRLGQKEPCIRWGPGFRETLPHDAVCAEIVYVL